MPVCQVCVNDLGKNEEIMGGFGSGRWVRWGIKTTVEESYVIDAAHWTRERILGSRAQRSGRWQWTNPYTGRTELSLRYEVTPRDAPETVR